MKRDNVIAMARSAGFGFMTEKPKSATHMQCGIVDLERFTQLVEAAAAKQWQATVDALLDHCPDAECDVCGSAVCPHGDDMHFHHDGCPSCAQADDEDQICSACNGSGEGMYDGSTCYKCKGTGEEPYEKGDDV